MSEKIPISGFNDRVKLTDVIPLKTPFTLNIFPTNLCNFRCAYCAHSKGYRFLKERYSMEKEAMSLQIFERILNQSREFPKKYKLLSFMGHGEPLLNKDLPEMVRIAFDAQIAERIEIITNGSLLTHILSDSLINAGLTNIRISVQGVNNESYEKICGKKIDYSSFLEEIRYYHSHKTRGGVFVKIMDIALANGDKDIFFHQYNDISDRMFIEEVKPVYQGVDIGLHANLKTDRYGAEHTHREVCPLPFFSLNIWPNGEVTPCDAIYKPIILGNVNDESIISMWNGERRRKFLLDQLFYRKKELPGCMDCCAPDDVSHPLDVLDDSAEDLRIHF